MRFLGVFFVLSSQVMAADYDPDFHLRHRYNMTKERARENDLTHTRTFIDPRTGMKNHPYTEAHQDKQEEQAPKGPAPKTQTPEE